jgi:membrane protease YdiL (CAAX protease family)
MAGGQNNEWWRPDTLPPALVIIGPYFLNKLIYIYFPGNLVFEATDYACRIFSLAALYLLLRTKPIRLPIPWRLAAPSIKELLLALIGTIILIGSNVIGMTFIRSLNAHSWHLTSYALLPSALQYLDDTVGMAFVALSEEGVFRFYLMNLLMLRGRLPTTTIIASTLIFAGIHWSYGVGAMVFAALAGLVTSVIFLSSRNLIAPIIVHAGYDGFFFAGGIAYLWRAYNGAW